MLKPLEAHIYFKMKKSISVAFGFVATVIGAGFASGKEILLYFSGTNAFTPLLAGVVLGALAYLFCEMGRTDGGIYSYFGKGKKALVYLIRTANFLVFCTTTAACEDVVFSLFGFHGGAVLTVLMTLMTLFVSKKAMGAVSFFCVAGILVMLFVVFFKTDIVAPRGKFSPLSSVTYAGMNMLTGGFFIATSVRDFSRKQSVSVALISCTILSVLLIVVFLLCSDKEEELFPMISAAEQVGLGYVGLVILYIAMYTTCNGTCFVAANDNVEKALLIATLSLGISCFGFEKLIGAVYPIIGAVGCGVITLCAALYFIKKSLRRNNLDVLIPDHADQSVL